MTTPAEPTQNAAAFSTADTSDIAQLSYEAALNELAQIVQSLEAGQSTLEDSIALWERGEALAAHCQAWLAGAQRRLDQATQASQAAQATE